MIVYVLITSVVDVQEWEEGNRSRVETLEALHVLPRDLTFPTLPILGDPDTVSDILFVRYTNDLRKKVA